MTMIRDPFIDHELDERRLVQALAIGQWLATRMEAFALPFDLPELGAIDLPSSAGSPLDQARIQALAPLYLAAELEATLLLPIAELLAGLYVSGGLSAHIGNAGPLMLAFWQGRHGRFTAQERQALFRRLFGSAGRAALVGAQASNTGFEPAMITLTEALHTAAFDGSYGDLTLQLAARQLAANLTARAGGVAAFAARDILATVQQAVDLFKQPALQQAFGGQGFWATVRAVAHAYLEQEPVIEQHLTRGRAGLVLLTWLAEALPTLDQPHTLRSPEQQVLAAATAWLQASLTLEEQRSQDA